MRKITICLVSALAVALAACGDDGGTATIDAANTPIDAPAAIDAAIDAPPPPPACSDYCTAVMANCTGANAQYASAAACMASCAAMPLGTLADTSGNTVGCRLYHGGAPSMGAPATHCVHAGPGGSDPGAAGSICGSGCAGFCQIARRACGNTPYADDADCMTKCAMFNNTVKYSITTNTNSLACRTYHATQASTTPNPHCGHIGPVSPTCAAAVPAARAEQTE